MLSEYKTNDAELLARVFAVSEPFVSYRLKHIYEGE